MDISGSPLSNMKIPPEQLYKVHYLDSSKTENKIIIFSNSKEPFNLNEMFSEDEILNIELNKIDVVFSSQQIYTDDTIRTIKKKIITEIGTNIISYPELYLFSKIATDMSLFQLYTSLTQDNKVPLDSVMLGQLLHNLGISDTDIINKIPVQDSYTYHDLTKYLSILEGKQELWQPIGPRFTNQHIDLLFQANPYNIINANNNPFHHSRENPLISFENNVLLTYGDIIKNTIYATSVSDVIEYGTTIQVNDEYIIPLYFPLLEKDGISTGVDVIQNKQKLLAKNDLLFDKSFVKIEENLHTIYDLYNNGSRDDIKYSQNGIQIIDFTIHPQSKVKLPLDVIFKSIHSTKKFPFIKYNPGSRFEKMYRAYSEEITKTGQQIPFLSKSAIMNYSKLIGKSLQIALVVQGTLQNKVFDVIVSINQNGDINIHADFSLKELDVPRSIAVFSLPSIYDLETYLKGIINETIDTLNSCLHNLGYQLQSFVDLKHKNIEIQNIHFKLWSPLLHDIDLKSLSPCLTNIFEIQEIERTSLKMNFKRVNNYTQMTAVNAMITDIYKKTNNEKDVINALILNYNYTEQQALIEFAKYLNDFTRINGQYVNKNIDIVENPGFFVHMGKLQTGLILHIDATQINNIRYIELLTIYFDSFLRVSQNIGINGISKSRINQLCSGKYESVKGPTIDNIIIPSNKAISPLSKDDMLIKDNVEVDVGVDIDVDDDDDDDDDDDEGFLYMDEDDDEDNEDTIDGGATKSKVKNLDPRKYLFDKLKLLEPELILSKEVGHYKAYSRACPSNVMRQPVILTNDEKKQIDRDNRNWYGYALEYGANKENPHWFICPRYWSLETNQPLTQSQVDSGKFSGKIHEFTDNKYHVDKDGNYVHHSPGFLPDETHPKYGVPCCFSKPWDSTQLESRRNKWGVTDNNIDIPKGTNWKEVIDGKETELTGDIEVKQPENGDKSVKPAKGVGDDINIVKYFSKLSFYENAGVWVFLPRSVQLFLDIDYQNNVSNENQQRLKENQSTYLLYTVERKYHQSFIGCIARIYADINDYHNQNIPVPTISKMRNIIADSITLDMFLQYHNGSLVSTFQPKRQRVEGPFLNKHYDSVFYKSLDTNIDAQMDFYEYTVASFNKFLEYLRDDDSWIDYVYLWDIVTSRNPNLFPNGMNLVILSVTDNDITDNVEIICPSNSYHSKIYDKNKHTLILVEQDNYYAIVSAYDNTNSNNSIKRTSTFGNSDNLPELRKMMTKIQHTTNKYCKPLPSMPKEYKYKQNIIAEDIFDILQKHQYIIDKQVSNYRGKIIGIIVRISEENTNTIFIPSFPSSTLENIPIIYMDNIEWSDYVNTRDTLLHIHKQTKGAILSKPLLKVVEDGLIVGILTETNQVLQVNPPVNNDIEDGINSIKVKGYADNGYHDADKMVQTTNTHDSARNAVVRNIRLETQFYSSFKTTIRIMLNDPNYLTIKEQLITTLNDNRYLYRIKLQKLELLIKHLLRNTVSFAEVDENVLKTMDNVSTCTEENKDKPYCIVKNNNYQLVIPSKNLISGIDNEKVYYGRIADELLRYKRIRLFMLEPKKYLNIGTVDYNLNETEVILLQSVLTDEYWENLKPFYRNTYIRNLNYDTAEPAISQKYSSEITLQQQQDTDISDDTSTFEKCIKEELKEVIGNNQSKWKQIFPTDSKEIVYHCSNICSYNLIQMIYQTHFSHEITVNELRSKLIRLYNEHVTKHKSKIYDILRKQNGKSIMIKKVIQNKVTIEDLIMSEDYYLTTLDVWILASDLKLPIMLFSQSPLENLNIKEDWIILGGNPMKDRFFFIRSPAISAKCPEYRMVTPQRPLYDLEGFSDFIETPANYINNNMEFSTYLEQVALVFD